MRNTPPQLTSTMLPGDRQKFQIRLPDGRIVFMQGEVTADYDIVTVYTDSFLRLWKAHPSTLHAHQRYGTPASWRRDYKFQDATAGYAAGQDNPVPLAIVDCFRFPIDDTADEEPRDCVGFTDGVTRTIWLLAHGVTVFPVSCYRTGAFRLQQLAGIDA